MLRHFDTQNIHEYVKANELLLVRYLHVLDVALVEPAPEHRTHARRAVVHRSCVGEGLDDVGAIGGGAVSARATRVLLVDPGVVPAVCPGKRGDATRDLNLRVLVRVVEGGVEVGRASGVELEGAIEAVRERPAAQGVGEATHSHATRGRGGEYEQGLRETHCEPEGGCVNGR